ncbi:MAG: hypothetical protein AAFX54_12760 [Pseudomonadota bacterium]
MALGLRFFSLVIASLSIIGCASDDFVWSQITVRTVPASIGDCGIIKSVSYKFYNNAKPKKDENNSFAERLKNYEKTDSTGKYFSAHLSGIEENLVRQDSSYDCYAAALSTAAKYYGRNIAKDYIVDKQVLSCSISKKKPATYLEILNTAAFLVSGQRSDYVPVSHDLIREMRKSEYSSVDISMDRVGNITGVSSRYGSGVAKTLTSLLPIPYIQLERNGQSFTLGTPPNQRMYGAPNQTNATTPNLNVTNSPSVYRNHPAAQTANKTVKPIATIDELIVSILNGEVVIIGLDGMGSGHVAIVAGVEFHPRGYFRDGNIRHRVYSGSYLKSVILLDPSVPQGKTVYSMSVRQFLANVDFMFQFRG